MLTSDLRDILILYINECSVTKLQYRTMLSFNYFSVKDNYFFWDQGPIYIAYWYGLLFLVMFAVCYMVDNHCPD